MQEYKSPELIVRFDPAVCTHSGNCVRGLREVFDIHRRPWVDVLGATKERIIEQIGKCPSGALTFEIPTQE